MYVCTGSVRMYIANHPKSTISAILYETKVVWLKAAQTNQFRLSPH